MKTICDNIFKMLSLDELHSWVEQGYVLTQQQTLDAITASDAQLAVMKYDYEDSLSQMEHDYKFDNDVEYNALEDRIMELEEVEQQLNRQIEYYVKKEK